MAAIGGIEGELIFEDEGSTSDDVVYSNQTLEGDISIACAVEAIHDGDDAGAGS